MVGHLLRLTWDQFRAQLRTSGWVLAGLIIAALYCLGAVAGVAIVFVTAGAEVSPSLISAGAVLLGLVLLLPWLLVPLVTPTPDPTLDAEALAPYPLRTGEVLLAQLLGSLVGLFGPISALTLLVPTLGWIHHPGALLLAPAAALPAWATMTALSRLVSAGAQVLSMHRVLSDSVGALVFLVALLAMPLAGGLVALVLDPQILGMVGVIGSWLPVGSAMALPGEFVQGNWTLLGVHALLSILYLAAAVLLWFRVIRWQAARVGSRPPRRRRVPGSASAGLFERLPATPTGAVAARTLIYLVKDPRFNLLLISLPAFLVLFYIMSGVSFSDEQINPVQLLMYGPVVAMLIGWQVSAFIVSYDHSAFSLHVSAPLTGREDRSGRALGMLLLFTPLILAFAAAAVLLAGGGQLLPGYLGLTLCLLLGGVGVGSVASVRLAYPVPPPGTSPWRMRRSGAGAANVLVQLGGALLVALIGSPALVLLIIAAVTGHPAWSWAGLLVGMSIGCAVLLIGIRLGGGWYARRAPELLQEVSRIR